MKRTKKPPTARLTAVLKSHSDLVVGAAKVEHLFHDTEALSLGVAWLELRKYPLDTRRRMLAYLTSRSESPK